MGPEVVLDKNLSRRRGVPECSEQGMHFLVVAQPFVNLRVPGMLGPHYQALARRASIQKHLQVLNGADAGLFKTKRRAVLAKEGKAVPRIKQANDLQIDAEQTTAKSPLATEADTIIYLRRGNSGFLERSFLLTGETFCFPGKGPEAIGVEAAVAG